jgi:FkbM family methyltransferase
MAEGFREVGSEMMDTVEVRVNDRWPIQVLPHRAGIPWATWEKARLDHMRSHIRRGDVVLDIGSEEGDFSTLFSLWGASVIPFEPDPYVWPNFKFTWEQNKLAAPEAYFCGFAANQTILTPPDVEPAFLLPQRDGWPGCAYGPIIDNHGFRNETERAHDTPSIKIDDFLDMNPKDICPAVITIDVEGAEFEVLKGAIKTLKRCRPLVYVSIHPEFIQDKYDYPPSEIFDLMISFGYEPEFITYDHESHWFFWPPLERLICSRRRF